MGAPLHADERGHLSRVGGGPRTEPPILLYDGSCGVCARSVQFLLRRDRRRKTLRFASLESPLGRGFVASEPGLEGVDSLVWIEADGPVPDSPEASASTVPRFAFRVRSDAVLEAGRYLGGAWAGLAALGRLVPTGLRDRLYDLFARNRHRVASRTESCLLPTPEERERFLDAP
jgi:predicted DCC family thiol-disulfide oxidoreductase YuxK